MKMNLNHNGQTITLDENEQSQVYEFYRLHCTMERLIDALYCENIEKQFKSDDDLKIVAKRVLNLIADYHISEDDAIITIFEDKNYINKYLE